MRLGEVCNVKTGKLDANASSPSGKYPFFTCANEPLKINTFSYDCECCLVAGNGDLNVKYYSGKFDAYQRTYIVESKNKNKLNTKYLYYLLENRLEHLREVSIGGIIKYIKLNNLTDIIIKYLPFYEQHSIANELDTISAVLTKQKKQYELLGELVKSKFIEMFGDPVANPMKWKMKQMSECGTLKNGINYAKNDSGYSVRCLGVGDFADSYTIEKMNEISFINLASKPADEYLLQDGDIVFVRSNGNRELVGRSVEVFPQSEKLTFSGFCIRYRNTSSELLTVYLNHALHLPTFRTELLSGGRGANIQNVNQQTLGALMIPLPPLAIQQQFAAFVNNIETSKTKLKTEIIQTETLYKTLMQKYFGDKGEQE